ncbi:MAG: hypothetical protein WCH60_10740 [Burkholderiales bacterium]
MSVINKMLRDLDHRQAAQASGAPSSPQAPLRQGITSIGSASGASGPARSRRWVWIGLCVLLAAAGAGGWTWMQANPDGLRGDTASPNISAPAPAPAPTAVVATPPAMPASAAVDSSVNQPESNVAPGAMVLRMEESLSARRALDALLSTPAPSAPAVASARLVAPATANGPTADRAKARATDSAQNAALQQPAATSATSPVKAPGGTVQPDPAPMVQRQQQAGGDAIAQAQNLWNSGSHDAAIDLMQQSIAAAERAAKGGSGASTVSLLTPLVREMARMQLAEGRFGAVWEMLTRLELQLGNQPDLWAIRANAAQRLGRHQDSVHAYMVALQSRPDEQRWLLGTAVSLAALGQTSSAAEMAEKARSVGPVSKDIVTYLRQAGVVFRD